MRSYSRNILRFFPLLLILQQAAFASPITSFSADKTVLRADGEPLKISLKTSPQTYSFVFASDEERVVKTFLPLEQGQWPADHSFSLSWDGYDSAGELCPPKAYTLHALALHLLPGLPAGSAKDGDPFRGASDPQADLLLQTRGEQAWEVLALDSKTGNSYQKKVSESYWIYRNGQRFIDTGNKIYDLYVQYPFLYCSVENGAGFVDEIRRYDLKTNVFTALVTGLEDPTGLVAEADFLYVSERKTLKKFQIELVAAETGLPRKKKKEMELPTLPREPQVGPVSETTVDDPAMDADVEESIRKEETRVKEIWNVELKESKRRDLARWKGYLFVSDGILKIYHKDTGGHVGNVGTRQSGEGPCHWKDCGSLAVDSTDGSDYLYAVDAGAEGLWKFQLGASTLPVQVVRTGGGFLIIQAVDVETGKIVPHTFYTESVKKDAPIPIGPIFKPGIYSVLYPPVTFKLERDGTVGILAGEEEVYTCRKNWLGLKVYPFRTRFITDRENSICGPEATINSVWPTVLGPLAYFAKGNMGGTIDFIHFLEGKGYSARRIAVSSAEFQGYPFQGIAARIGSSFLEKIPILWARLASTSFQHGETISLKISFFNPEVYFNPAALSYKAYFRAGESIEECPMEKGAGHYRLRIPEGAGEGQLRVAAGESVSYDSPFHVDFPVRKLRADDAFALDTADGRREYVEGEDINLILHVRSAEESAAKLEFSLEGMGRRELRNTSVNLRSGPNTLLFRMASGTTWKLHPGSYSLAVQFGGQVRQIPLQIISTTRGSLYPKVYCSGSESINIGGLYNLSRPTSEGRAPSEAGILDLLKKQSGMLIWGYQQQNVAVSGEKFLLLQDRLMELAAQKYQRYPHFVGFFPCLEGESYLPAYNFQDRRLPIPEEDVEVMREELWADFCRECGHEAHLKNPPTSYAPMRVPLGGALSDPAVLKDWLIYQSRLYSRLTRRIQDKTQAFVPEIFIAEYRNVPTTWPCQGAYDPYRAYPTGALPEYSCESPGAVVCMNAGDWGDVAYSFSLYGSVYQPVKEQGKPHWVSNYRCAHNKSFQMRNVFQTLGWGSVPIDGHPNFFPDQYINTLQEWTHQMYGKRERFRLISRMLDQYGEIFLHTKRKKSLALLASFTQHLKTGPDRQLSYSAALREAFFTTLLSGYAADFIFEKDVEEGRLQGYQALFVVGQTVDFPPGVLSELQKFLGRGGILIRDKVSTLSLPSENSGLVFGDWLEWWNNPDGFGMEGHGTEYGSVDWQRVRDFCLPKARTFKKIVASRLSRWIETSNPHLFRKSHIQAWLGRKPLTLVLDDLRQPAYASLAEEIQRIFEANGQNLEIKSINQVLEAERYHAAVWGKREMIPSSQIQADVLLVGSRDDHSLIQELADAGLFFLKRFPQGLTVVDCVRSAFCPSRLAVTVQAEDREGILKGIQALFDLESCQDSSLSVQGVRKFFFPQDYVLSQRMALERPLPQASAGLGTSAPLPVDDSEKLKIFDGEIHLALDADDRAILAGSDSQDQNLLLLDHYGHLYRLRAGKLERLRTLSDFAYSPDWHYSRQPGTEED